MSQPLHICRFARERVGAKRWQVDISLPDDDPMLAGSGSGTSNLPGESAQRLIFQARTPEVFERLGCLLIIAAEMARSEDDSSGESEAGQ